jgi:flagellar motor switch protein FliN/FliY
VNQAEVAQLLEVVGTAIAAAARNLAILLGTDVVFSRPSLAEAYPVYGPDNTFVVASVGFTEGIQGETVLTLTRENAEAIVRQMLAHMGMEAGGDLLDEMGLSALGEAINQLVAGIGRSLAEQRGEVVNISPPTIRLVYGDQVVAIANDRLQLVTWEASMAGASGSLFWSMPPVVTAALSSGSAVATPSALPTDAPAVAAQPDAGAKAQAQQASATPPARTGARPLGGLADVTLDVVIELGRRLLPLQEILSLGQGGVVALDRPVSEPVDLLVNGRRTARGEMVVVNGRLGLKVTELID